MDKRWLQRDVERLKTQETGGIWVDYAPVWTADGGTTTLGNGTLNGRYCRVGKLVTMNIQLVWGTTTSVTGNNWYFTIPANNYAGFYTGSAWIVDSGLGYYFGTAIVTSNGVSVYTPNWLTATTPMTWANGDRLTIQVAYEAA